MIVEKSGKGENLVNCRDLDGRLSTPTHFAAGYNRIEVLRYLLEHGADVHAKDKGGLAPLHNSASYGTTLLQYICDSKLYATVYSVSGHYEVTEMLIEHNANVNVADLWKFTPLHEAAAKGKFEIW